MRTQTAERTALADRQIPVQAKLAAAWTSLMFLIIYIDYFHLYQPGEIDDIRGGVIFVFDISGTLMSIFFAIIAIPALMMYNYLTNRVEEMSVDIADASNELVDFFLKEGRFEEPLTNPGTTKPASATAPAKA